jgi:hypothetical protein
MHPTSIASVIKANRFMTPKALEFNCSVGPFIGHAVDTDAAQVNPIEATR